jgi:hypothetical protein
VSGTTQWAYRTLTFLDRSITVDVSASVNAPGPTAAACKEKSIRRVFSLASSTISRGKYKYTLRNATVSE